MTSPVWAQNDAKAWLIKMNQATKTLNYEMSFVIVHNDKAEPWRWFHGTIEEQEREILTALNGPGQQLIRKGDTLTYLQPEQAAYSIKDTVSHGPLPEILRTDISHVEQSYDFHLMGKSRVAGLPARLIRVLARDAARYDYWLWLHEDTGLLLKSAIVNKNNEILEQLQVSHLQVTNEPSEILQEIHQAELPEAFTIKNSAPMSAVDWQITWIPAGFEPVKVDRHYLFGSKNLVDYVMLSDGVVWFSVYLRRLDTDETIAATALSSGANSYLTKQINQAEVTVIGKVPLPTAEKLIGSIRWD
ncbi:MucB/RseB C-terminal domain-containing protein [Catenovulum sp. 2E275]|uniref:MucB/RseB C-terminal domain-containing protein n=1 Tax=Catenovulum sp. 2E275 TaxID=2980497 RepID=UPI0021D1D1A2|nr:MucB/RseB C-terminal domain-containing protein [Catenovulum sp. 2E275]MCU4675935.1 MucB/RseB C-terminal domain-containing protein [Catenovulum sp. 2E275]